MLMKPHVKYWSIALRQTTHDYYSKFQQFDKTRRDFLFPKVSEEKSKKISPEVSKLLKAPLSANLPGRTWTHTSNTESNHSTAFEKAETTVVGTST